MVTEDNLNDTYGEMCRHGLERSRQTFLYVLVKGLHIICLKNFLPCLSDVNAGVLSSQFDDIRVVRWSIEQAYASNHLHGVFAPTVLQGLES